MKNKIDSRKSSPLARIFLSAAKAWSSLSECEISALAAAALCLFALSAFGQPAKVVASAPVHSDLTLLQCGNLIYAGSQSSVCFADNFLSDVAAQTNLKVNKKFCPVRLDADALFDYPFCVMSGNENFHPRAKGARPIAQIPHPGRIPAGQPGLLGRKMGQILPPGNQGVLPGRSRSRQSRMTHPIFSIVNQIPKLASQTRQGRQAGRTGDQRPPRAGLFQGGPERRATRQRLLLLRRRRTRKIRRASTSMCSLMRPCTEGGILIVELNRTYGRDQTQSSEFAP